MVEIGRSLFEKTTLKINSINSNTCNDNNGDDEVNDDDYVKGYGYGSHDNDWKDESVSKCFANH